MRYLYTFLFYLALPLVFLRLLWRSRRLPAYRNRLHERFGYYSINLDRCFWVHAVSVGETMAALPLIRELQKKYPDVPLVVTTMTPTGAARVKAALGDSVFHLYLPYDLPAAVNRFLRAVKPKIALIMETELWPNMFAACKQQGIPICLLNARLSEKSARGYRRVGSLTREMLSALQLIAANAALDAERFVALGALKERVIVTGNIKFDLDVPETLPDESLALRAALGEERFIWIAASTHEGEEEQILAVHQKLRVQNPQALLILVPRHPDRFDQVAKRCAREGVVLRRSDASALDEKTGIYLGDTMGELLLLYSVADVAFVGGSLVPRGGHNILEPAALGKAIVVGPHLFNFTDIRDMFDAAHALITVADENALFSELVRLMRDANDREAMGQRALRAVNANRGALTRQLNLVCELL